MRLINTQRLGTLTTGLLCLSLGMGWAGERAPSDHSSTSSSQSAPVPPTSAPEVEVRGQDPSGCTVVTAKAHISFALHDTQLRAREQAVAEARRRAVEHVVGVEIEGHDILVQKMDAKRGASLLMQSFLQERQRGQIVRERQLRAGPVQVPGYQDMRYSVELELCVRPFPEARDRNFRVTVELNKTHLTVGEEVTVKILSNRDGYVYLYSVYQLDNDKGLSANLLFPNEGDSANRIVQGRPFAYPTEKLRRQKWNLQTQLPATLSENVEQVYVVVSKAPLPLAVYDPAAEGPAKTVRAGTEVVGEGNFFALAHKLAESQAEWVEALEEYTVYRK